MTSPYLRISIAREEAEVSLDRPAAARILSNLWDRGDLQYTHDALMDDEAGQQERAVAILADLCRLGKSSGWSWLTVERPTCALDVVEHDGWLIIPLFSPDEGGMAHLMCIQSAWVTEEPDVIVVERRDDRALVRWVRAQAAFGPACAFGEG